MIVQGGGWCTREWAVLEPSAGLVAGLCHGGGTGGAACLPVAMVSG